LIEEEVVDSVDAFFNMHAKPSDFLPEGLDAIKSIDHAAILDVKLGTILTPFGVTDI
jgi:hypothetical protein